MGAVILQCPATLLFPPHIHILLLCDQYHPNHSYFHFPKLSVYKETCIDHMMAPMRMEEDRSHMTEKILNLTLEIIYLLTGERFPLLKSGDHMTITVPPCDSLKPERHNMQKILEVTKKMMELLTGEVSGAGKSGTFSSNRQGMCLDVTVSLCVSGSYKMDPVMGTHQRDVPVLCIPGIPHRKVTPSLTIIR
ncbi:unnamed protein product [Staurois parvus]|uniref:Uncharacterized protein n=1 Tax=Staurois parvus TaxID=386267 RepID=A0ABN9AZQ0_9NEOB|nr:unnamed protein product [Staurois parvus]